MAKYNQLQESAVNHVVVYGLPKTGKSTLVAELANHGYHLWWFDIDGGAMSIISKLPERSRNNFDIFPIPDLQDNPVAIRTCRIAMTGGSGTICDLHGEINCGTCKAKGYPVTPINFNALDPTRDIVVFDHCTRLAFSARNQATKGKPEGYKDTYDDWRYQGMLLDSFFDRVQKAKFNVICIAQVVEAEDEDGKKKLFPDVGTKNFSTSSGQYFDHMVYVTVANKKHMAGSSSTYMLNVVTGSRSDVEIEKLEIPSLLPIFQGKVARNGGSEHYGTKTAASTLASASQQAGQHKQIAGDGTETALGSLGLSGQADQGVTESSIATSEQGTTQNEPVRNVEQVVPATPTTPAANATDVKLSAMERLALLKAAKR